MMIMVKLLTRPLSHLVTEVELLQNMDVDLVQPFPHSMISEVDSLMQVCVGVGVCVCVRFFLP